MDKAIAKDPALAERVLLDGGTVVFLNVPRGTEVGIDLCSWHTDTNFKGFKIIPPGIHFIYYSACSKDGQTAPRTGFFHNFQSKEVVIKKYDRQLEDIVEVQIEDIDEEQRQNHLRNFDKHLAPYPYELWKEWVSLTNHLTGDVLEELMPLNRKISSASEFIPDPSANARVSNDLPKSSNNPEDMLPKMILRPGTEIRFTDLRERCYPDGCSAAEISKHNMDHSYKLYQILNRYKNEMDILGELQMAFTCFVVGQVYEAFEQWQRLFQLLCSCDDALVDRHCLFLNFITILHFQLNHLPEDIFVDIVTKTNFLTTNLQVFFSNLESSKAPKELTSRAKRFQSFLTNKYKWDFDCEPDDCAPVIVETEDQ